MRLTTGAHDGRLGEEREHDHGGTAAWADERINVQNSLE
jgi:hypothetical protein